MEVIRKIGYPANIFAKIISKLLQDGEIWHLFWESHILWPPFLPGPSWEPYPCALLVTGALTAHQSSVCLQQVAAITESDKWSDTEISSRGLARSKPAAQSLYLSMEDEGVGEWEQRDICCWVVSPIHGREAAPVKSQQCGYLNKTCEDPTSQHVAMDGAMCTRPHTSMKI